MAQPTSAEQLHRELQHLHAQLGKKEALNEEEQSQLDALSQQVLDAVDAETKKAEMELAEFEKLSQIEAERQRIADPIIGLKGEIGDLGCWSANDITDSMDRDEMMEILSDDLEDLSADERSQVEALVGTLADTHRQLAANASSRLAQEEKMRGELNIDILGADADERNPLSRNINTRQGKIKNLDSYAKTAQRKHEDFKTTAQQRQQQAAAQDDKAAVLAARMAARREAIAGDKKGSAAPKPAEEIEGMGKDRLAAMRDKLGGNLKFKDEPPTSQTAPEPVAPAAEAPAPEAPAAAPPAPPPPPAAGAVPPAPPPPPAAGAVPPAPPPPPAAGVVPPAPPPPPEQAGPAAEAAVPQAPEQPAAGTPPPVPPPMPEAPKQPEAAAPQAPEQPQAQGRPPAPDKPLPEVPQSRARAIAGAPQPEPGPNAISKLLKQFDEKGIKGQYDHYRDMTIREHKSDKSKSLLQRFLGHRAGKKPNSAREGQIKDLTKMMDTILKDPNLSDYEKGDMAVAQINILREKIKKDEPGNVKESGLVKALDAMEKQVKVLQEKHPDKSKPMGKLHRS